jgi:hypothetical protein
MVTNRAFDVAPHQVRQKWAAPAGEKRTDNPAKFARARSCARIAYLHFEIR